MELKIRTKIGSIKGLKAIVETIKQIEKEYNCDCTLLDVEVIYFTLN